MITENLNGFQVMIDLETMGVGPNAAIIAISAVHFDFDIIDTFYRSVSLHSSVRCGGEIDVSTVEWWMSQNEEAKKVFMGRTITIEDALRDFASWLNHVQGYQNHIDKLMIWGNGSDFDNVILMSAYRRCGLNLPWSPFNNRCYRTVKNMVPGLKIERSGTHHNALDDVKDQANHLIRILDKLYIQED